MTDVLLVLFLQYALGDWRDIENMAPDLPWLVFLKGCVNLVSWERKKNSRSVRKKKSKMNPV